MLGTFLDKATGILDRQFLLAYWFPVFIASVMFIPIKVYVCGTEVSNWWKQDWMLNAQLWGLSGQTWFVIGTLITITFLAYLLKLVTQPMIRFYEGYWPLTLWELFKHLPMDKISVWNMLTDQLRVAEKNRDWKKYNQLQTELFYSYPQKENRIMPTGLGNALRAAEDYSNKVYGMDSVFWWPRLWFLLPDLVRKDIDESFVPIVALLNFSSLITIEALFGFGYIMREGFDWQVLLVLLVGLPILAYISYRTAVRQAKIYGIKIRAAIDIYRFDLLKALHQPLPDTLDDEKKLWQALLRWVYTSDFGSVSNMKYKHDKGPLEDFKNG